MAIGDQENPLNEGQKAEVDQSHFGISLHHYYWGLVLNGIVVLQGIGILIGEAAIVLYYVSPIGDRVTRQLFSAIYSVVALAVAAMCMIWTRRLLRRMVGA